MCVDFCNFAANNRKGRRDMKKVVLTLISVLTVMLAGAQNGELQLNREYEAAIRSYLEQDVANRERTMQERALQVLTALPNEHKLYDENFVKIESRIVEDNRADGSTELDFVYEISYTCKHEEGVTDDYPLGEYHWDMSNSARVICKLTQMFVDGVLDDIFRAGKEVTVRVTSTADGTDIAGVLAYDGEYGDFRYMPVVFNGEMVRLSVDRSSGISNNAQLAYIRAQSVRDFLDREVKNLGATRNNYEYITRSYADTGAQYRRSSIELVVHDAFRENIELMTADKIQDDYVDFNIPQCAGSYENAFVLIISNEDYADVFLPNVPFASHDAEVMKRYFVRALGVPERHVRVLKNATKDEIVTDGVNWLTDLAQAVAVRRGDAVVPQANLFIYYAGHGYTGFDNVMYLMPNGLNVDGIRGLRDMKTSSLRDVKSSKRGEGETSGAVVNYDIALREKESGKLTKEMISIEGLLAMFKGYPVNNMTMIVDASFDGHQRNGEPMLHADRKEDGKRRSRKVNLRSDAVVLMAAESDRTAYAFDAQRHGFLTYFLLKEVKSIAGQIDGYTYKDLYDGIAPKLSKESALQGRWQEIYGIVGGKYKDNWQNQRLK